MKLTLIFSLFLGLLCSMAETNAQVKKLNLKIDRGTVREIVEEIERQTDYAFMYDNNAFDVSREISVEVQNSTVEQVMDKIVEGQDLKYEIVNRYIVISSTNETKAGQVIGKLSGTVVNTMGEPIPGVTIVVKGTTNGTISDFDGKYVISNVPSDAILLFSFVGMKSQEVPIGSRSVIDIVLEEDAIGVDEVVVVGYGTKMKRDLTGSITSVSGEQLADTKSESFTQALQGRAAGVYVRSNSGIPGGGVSVRIRGIGGINDSEPLYIVDGIQIGGSATDTYNPLSGLNPNDIKSIEVLKDASSAAIYGARAANGVVIITTKRGGKPNQKSPILHHTVFKT